MIQKRNIFALCIVVVVAVVGQFLYRTIALSQKRNVIVILVDTLRADHLGVFGYERDTSPNLNNFADANTSFNFCNAAAPWTPASIASLFTGLYPSAHGMMPPTSQPEKAPVSTALSPDLRTMAEAYKDGGYTTAAVITNPWLKVGFGYNQGFDKYSYIDRVNAEKVNKEAFKLLDSLQTGAEPFFLYLHYMDVHNPWNPPEPYKSRYKEALTTRHYGPRETRNMALYDGSIRYLDEQLNVLFSDLKRRGLYDDSIILVVADHGEQFGEHGHNGHGFGLYNEEQRVPCFLKYDGERREVDFPVSLIDFYPTLMELSGIAKPEGIQGYSLFAERAKRMATPVLGEVKRVKNTKSLVDPGGRKLLNHYPMESDFLLPEGEKPMTSELYDSNNVKSEEVPLVDEALHDQLQGVFTQQYGITRQLREKVKESKVDMDPGTMNELKSLGYL